MPSPALIARTRELWESLAGTAARFTPAISVAVSPRSYLCPPGWTGVVVIDDAGIATAPDHVTARRVQQALSDLPTASLTDTAVLRTWAKAGAGCEPWRTRGRTTTRSPQT
jgi:hypothetical protein